VGGRIGEGAWFKPQVGELIVGKGATSRFAQLKVGDRPVFHGRPWRVVGVFEAGGQAYESEVWGDVDELGQEWKRSYSSILIRVANASSIPGLAKAMDEDRQIQLEGKGLAEYYQDQNQGSMMLKAMGVMMGVVLAIGGVFGAANTMYAAVAARSKEIATMRVLGFSRAAIWFSFMLEAGALGIAGGVLGSAAAYLLVDGMTSGSVNWQTFTDLAFHFRVTPGLMAGGIVLSAIAAVAGGFFPAWRASRQGIAAALRGV
jgi:putative ABC transport system permease protein